MRALAWIVWIAFVFTTCNSVVALPMVAHNMPPANASTRGVIFPLVFVAVPIGLSLYSRFFVLPRLLSTGRIGNPSGRLLLNLLGCWFLCLFSIGGAVGIARSDLGMEAGLITGIAATLVVSLESPWFRVRRGASRENGSAA